MESKKVKPLIGIPMERTVTDIAFIRFWEIAVYSGAPLIPLPYGRCDVNRNRLARFLMQTDYTHLVMLDVDHVHPVDIVQRLTRWQEEDLSRLVVGGLNFKRAHPYDACAYLRMSDGLLHAVANWGDGLAKVDAIGFGCVSFSRSVFDLIPDPWFQTVYDREDNFPGEDMFFSKLCEDRKIDIWCDTTTTSPHIGVNLIDQSFYKKHSIENPEEIYAE